MLDENGLLIYIFENREAGLGSTSGAPILNAAGEIVAIQTAAGRLGRVLFAIGTPVGKFRPALETALKTRPTR